jgi:hypothetical protein
MSCVSLSFHSGLIRVVGSTRLRRALPDIVCHVAGSEQPIPPGRCRPAIRTGSTVLKNDFISPYPIMRMTRSSVSA